VTATATPAAATEPPSPPGNDRRAPRLGRWIAIGLAVVLVALLAVLATREPAQNTLARSPLLGKPAPEVIGPGLDGRSIRLTSFRGRYVVLNFFASWCEPCQREHDDLLRFSATHKDAGDAVVLAVVFADDPENVREFFSRLGGDWPILTDERGKVSLDFGVRGPPESFLIDPDGIVRSKITGEVTDAGLDALIRRAEAQRAAKS
jgi:cytochrome c biogenesis protein CcmG/thiol:disulfide interchange protein DsbE